MRIALLLLFFFCAAALAEPGLLWPLPDHEFLTGGYADTRPDHFHGGVDVRTRGENLPVVAPLDGWVERIGVNPPGYGRTLYFRLENGKTAVFGHLSRFIPVLEQMLRDSETVAGTYRVDFGFSTATPERQFHRGDTLAFTGQTGIGPPHFHFELREGTVQTDPLAPFEREDHEPPVITSISWTRLSEASPWDAGHPLPLKKTGVGQYATNPVACNEPVAFFVRCWDPNPWGRKAVPKAIYLKVNGNIVFASDLSRVELLGPRNIYSKIVWPPRLKSAGDLRRIFALPLPESMRKDTPTDGWLTDLSAQDVMIEVEDRAGNLSQITLQATAGSWPTRGNKNQPGNLSAGDFQLITKNDAAISWCRMSEISPMEIRIEPESVSFGDRLSLSYSTSGVAASKGLFFYSRGGKGRLRPNSRFAADSAGLHCEILHGGVYGVAIDLAPPSLKLSVQKKKLRFRLSDALSGVDDSTIRCKVDDRISIAEFEYEERGGWIWTPHILERGSHKIIFQAADRAGNLGEWRQTLFIP